MRAAYDMPGHFSDRPSVSYDNKGQLKRVSTQDKHWDLA